MDALREIFNVAATLPPEVGQYLIDNGKTLALGGIAAIGLHRLTRSFNKFALFRGYAVGNDVNFSTTDYYPITVNDQKLYDQFIDTTGFGIDINDIFNGASNKVSMQYINAAKRKALYGTSSRLKIPFVMMKNCLRFLKGKNDFVETGDNILVLVKEILDEKIKDPKKRFRIQNEISRRLKGFLRANIDITDGIFKDRPEPDSFLQNDIDTNKTGRPNYRTVYPILMLEKSATTTQFRMFLVRDFELNANHLPKKEAVRIHLGEDRFEVVPNHGLMQRHKTMSNIIQTHLKSTEPWLLNPSISSVSGQTLAQSVSVSLQQ